jgi:Phosphoenolpyruvate carboxylase (EC 4.1.1.31)
MGIIANGQLLDTLRRVKCFGVPLVRIDIRQESTRHTEAIAEVTRYLGWATMKAGQKPTSRRS